MAEKKSKQCKICPFPREEGRTKCKDMDGNIICLQVAKERRNGSR